MPTAKAAGQACTLTAGTAPLGVDGRRSSPRSGPQPGVGRQPGERQLLGTGEVQSSQCPVVGDTTPGCWTAFEGQNLCVERAVSCVHTGVVDAVCTCVCVCHARAALAHKAAALCLAEPRVACACMFWGTKAPNCPSMAPGWGSLWVMCTTGHCGKVLQFILALPGTCSFLQLRLEWRRCSCSSGADSTRATTWLGPHTLVDMSGT